MNMPPGHGDFSIHYPFLNLLRNIVAGFFSAQVVVEGDEFHYSLFNKDQCFLGRATTDVALWSRPEVIKIEFNSHCDKWYYMYSCFLWGLFEHDPVIALAELCPQYLHTYRSFFCAIYMCLPWGLEEQDP